MRVLVLGASGLLGGWIYHKLKCNCDLTVLGTCCSSDSKIFSALDLLDSGMVKTFLNSFNPDTVIWSVLNRKYDKELTELGIPNLLSNISQSTRVIFVSTDAFAEGKGNYSEDYIMTYYNCINPISKYVNAKIDGERLIMQRNNSVVVRTGPIYGKSIEGFWSKREAEIIECLGAGCVLERANNMYKTFVHVEDLADSIVYLVNSNRKGIVHAGPESKESYYTFTKKIAQQLGLDCSLISEYCLSESEAIKNGIPLDTSMNTTKFRRTCKVKFRGV